MYPRLPAVTSSWPGAGCAPPMRSNAPAGHRPACITATTSWNVTRRPPSTTGFGSHSTASPCPAGPQIIAAGIPALRRPCRTRQSVPAGRIRHGPSSMRWRGPARPRRTGWSVVWPCRRRAPPAGARYPRERPVSRLLPRSRRRPRVVPVSSGKAFLLHTRAPRKSPAGSHFWFLRYPRSNPQEAAGYIHFTAVIHGIIHSLSSAWGPRAGERRDCCHRM